MVGYEPRKLASVPQRSEVRDASASLTKKGAECSSGRKSKLLRPDKHFDGAIVSHFGNDANAGIHLAKMPGGAIGAGNCTDRIVRPLARDRCHLDISSSQRVIPDSEFKPRLLHEKRSKLP